MDDLRSILAGRAAFYSKAEFHLGPGRAGVGEELGGHRALGFYHRRAAVQASQEVLQALPSASSLGKS